MSVPASIVIPTRARVGYLDVALRSIAPQAAAHGAEIVVVEDDDPSAEVRRVAEAHGARWLTLGGRLGLNAARNAGVEHTTGELVIFLDDDIDAAPGWLEALLHTAGQLPDVDVFTGPIRPRLEGRAPRSCGREGPPVTSLDLGPHDADVPYAWGANMALRRSALERVGRFDESLEGAGDEQEWQDRLRTDGAARVRYVAGAAVDHRRSAADSGLRRLCAAARRRGQASRRFDVWRGQAPSRVRELVTLLGCVGHVVRRRCPAGLVMVAHSAGRLGEALRPGVPVRVRPPVEDFLSGASGTVGGFDGVRRRARDGALDARAALGGQRLRLARAARVSPARRRVLVLGIVRPQHARLAGAIRRELGRSRHLVEMHTAPVGAAGKFENLNSLLASHPARGHDWLLVIDDDVVLPAGFLDRFLFLAERFSLSLAQPAHRLASHAAWEVTRRRPGSAVRETRFVEIGPVTGFAAATFDVLLPFPPLSMGWGLDVHWAALAAEHGWRCGVVDALPIRHAAAPAASAYSRETAIAEARRFLRDRPYLAASEATRTLATHRRW